MQSSAVGGVVGIVDLVVQPNAHVHPDTIASIVKRAAEELGKDPSKFGGHSLRAGFVTIAASNGATIEEIMHTTRHRSFEQVRGYIRRESPFERNASRVFFDPKKKAAVQSCHARA
jgi:integrase